MGTPRRCALSRLSRTMQPAPSPMTKPSRPRSQGRLAAAGLSLRRESARAAIKPPMPDGRMAASVAPATQSRDYSATPSEAVLGSLVGHWRCVYLHGTALQAREAEAGAGSEAERQCMRGAGCSRTVEGRRLWRGEEVAPAIIKSAWPARMWSAALRMAKLPEAQALLIE